MLSNALVPELSVSDIRTSLAFYTRLLGFDIAYQREDEGFAFLTLGAAQLMLDEIGKTRTWATGDLVRPLGRGINFQICVERLAPLLTRLRDKQVTLYLEPEERWYRKEEQQVGNRQFLVQDPDGYLLRFFEDLGSKPL